MKLFVFLLIITSLVSSSCSATWEPEPATDWLQCNYQPLTSLKQVPKPVLDELIKKMSYDPKLADRGEKFRATDVIIDETIPCRRFILGGKSDQFVLICYEHGGYGLHSHLAVFDVTSSKPKLIFTSTYLQETKTVEEIKNLVRNDKIKNKIGNIHQEW